MSEIIDTELVLDFDWKREMHLVRGLPGSGKSTLAHEIMGSMHSSKPPCFNGVFEADQFAMHEGQYKFSLPLLSMAHDWCLASSMQSLRSMEKIAVSNTFTKLEYLIPYLLCARKFHIKTFIHVPEGNALSVEELAERNTHDVPVEKIQMMKDQWEIVSQHLVEEFVGLPNHLRTV